MSTTPAPTPSSPSVSPGQPGSRTSEPEPSQKKKVAPIPSKPAPRAGPGSRDPSAPPQGSPREARGGEKGELRGLPGVYPDTFEPRSRETEGEASRPKDGDAVGGEETREARETEAETPENPPETEESESPAPKRKLKFAGREYDDLGGAEHAHRTLQGNFRSMQKQRDEAAHAAWAHKERADALEKQLAEMRETGGAGPGASSLKGSAPGTPGYDPQTDPHLPAHMKVHAARMAEEQARQGRAQSAPPQSRQPEPDLQSLLEDPILDGVRNPTPESVYDASKAFSEQFDWGTYHALKQNIGTEAAERYLESERESHWGARVKQLLAGPLREINQFRTTLRTTQLFEQAQESGQYPELLVPKQAHLIAQIWAQVSRAVDPKFAMSPAGVHYAVLLYRDYVRRHANAGSGPESAAQPGNGRAAASPGSPGGTPASTSTSPTSGDSADALAAAVTSSLRPQSEALDSTGSVPQTRQPAPPQARSEVERKRAIREADLYIPGLGFGR